MSERIFSDLGIRNPDFHLGVGSGSHASQTGDMMKALEEVMIEKEPGLVIVFGDTNSTLAGLLLHPNLIYRLYMSRPVSGVTTGKCPRK
jgi:UDP-GlcNAc3NAcA epimerase